MKLQDTSSDRQPKGDHNRRLSLELGPEQFAAEAGVTVEELRDYERTAPDQDFDPAVAARVGAALERLEAVLPNATTGRRSAAAGNASGPEGLSGYETTQGVPTMDHTNHIRLSPTELTAETLEGATIYGADDHKVGKISHLHGGGVGGQAIIDVGGFLGIGAKPVAVDLSELEFMRDENGDVHAVTMWTKDQLENMPEHHH